MIYQHEIYRICTANLVSMKGLLVCECIICTLNCGSGYDFGYVNAFIMHLLKNKWVNTNKQLCCLIYIYFLRNILYIFQQLVLCTCSFGGPSKRSVCERCQSLAGTIIDLAVERMFSQVLLGIKLIKLLINVR